jgi:hypothetical protein
MPDRRGPEGSPAFELKPLSAEGIDAALRKAERYRLLNEPWQAESICLDILAVDPANQSALVLLLLALTDQFASERNADPREARALLPRLSGEYERAYYAGIISERRASALLERGASGTGPIAYEGFRDAMEWYERAGRVRPPGNDDALLRWNTCARAIMKHAHVRPAPDEPTPMGLE